MSHKDIDAIKQKINRINRRKPVGENIRNIETMQNIYDATPPPPPPPPPTPTKTVTHDIFPNIDNELPPFMKEFSMFMPQKQNQDDDADANKKSCSACDGEIKEGFSLNDISTAFSGAGLNIPIVENNQLYQFLFYIPNTIKYIVSSFALSFTKVLTELDLKNTETEDQILNDAQIVEKIIYYIISFPLAVFIMYNWFYVIVYRDNDIYLRDKCDVPEIANNVYGKPTCRPANDNQRTKINFDGYQSKDLLEFFLFFIIIPFKLFDTYIIGDKYVPHLMCYIPWKILCKLISLFIAFLIVFWVGLFDTFVYIVNGNTTILSFINTIIIVIFFVYSIIYEVYNNESISLSFDSKKTPNNNVDVAVNVGENILNNKEEFVKAGTAIGNVLLANNHSTTFFGIFSRIIKFTIRLVIAIFSIPISSVLLNMYICFISFFGILFFGGGIENFVENFNKMEIFVESDIYKLFDKNKDDCVKPSILMLILKSITKFIYRNFYTFIMLFLIGVNMYDTIMNMNSVIVKYMIIGLLGSPALFLLLGIISGDSKITENP